MGALLQTVLDGLRWPARLLGAALLIGVLVVQAITAGDQTLSWRDGWWDTIHQAFPRDRGDPAQAPAVVVAIDEDTMAATQRWPWPRDLLAELMEALVRHGATVIAFDIFLDDADPQSPTAIAERFRQRGAFGAAELMDTLEDSDAALARTIYAANRQSGVPTVMPVPGVPPNAAINPELECRFEKPVVLMQPESVRGPLGRGFPSADPPPLLYREAGSALAAVDLDVGENLMVRKMRAVQPICGAPFLMLGAEALRQAQQGFYTVVRRTWSGMEVVLDDPANADAIRFPAERDGSFWLHFGEVGVEEAGGERVLRRYISAREVMAPEFDSQRLAGKIALLAVIDLGRIDERRAPIGSIIFGVEAHMQMIEQIVDRDFLRRPWFMPWAEAALLALLGLLVIWLVPLVRAQVSVALAGGLVAALLAGSAVAFRAGLLVDAASPAFGLSIVFVGVIAATLVDRDRQRLLAQLDLASERADRAFLQGELDAAARIQMALLPARRFQKPGLIDLACHIEPARTVGGDFYDHVLVDDRHLFFLVADVSGKGADASQFMLLSKTLWKSVALRTGAPLDRIQIEANAEITRENTATMFVTGLCGLLDLETGELSYSSAGHDQPFRFRPGVAPEQLESFSGPPAGLMDGITFPVGQVSLKAGDRLFIFSDGVTEAMDRSGRLYGLERLAQDLGDAPTEADSSALVEHVLGRVRAFTGDAEQSDDLTIMALTIPEAGVAGGSE